MHKEQSRNGSGPAVLMFKPRTIGTDARHMQLGSAGHHGKSFDREHDAWAMIGERCFGYNRDLAVDSHGCLPWQYGLQFHSAHSQIIVGVAR